MKLRKVSAAAATALVLALTATACGGDSSTTIIESPAGQKEMAEALRGRGR